MGNSTAHLASALATLVATVAVCCAACKDSHAAAQAKQAQSERAQAEFFERRIRPIFAEYCQACHGPKRQQGGLRLDGPGFLKDGSDSGSVVVPGKPEKSLLIEAIGYGGAIQMPPKGKLPEAIIIALADWVRGGAKWPSTGAAAGPVDQKAELRRAVAQHWAFRPIADPRPSAVNNRQWPRTPIDRFILKRLEDADLEPAPPADRRTLLRRASFDLHGLPPSKEAIEAFEADASPDSFRRVIDSLLASPRYGERWGRHWLDVARYSDTKGYVRLMENPRYPTAWTYRDYVVRAFNSDLPFDRFIIEQIAADQLSLGDDTGPLAAMGFLTLGERFINSRNDIIDDRIDVVTRGLLGLTVSCARCHDHKFDPIPTEDYYSLYGVFASSIEPRIPPPILRSAERTDYAEYFKKFDARTEDFQRFLTSEYEHRMRGFRERAGEYLLASRTETVQGNFLAAMFLVDAETDLNPVMVQRWARVLQRIRPEHESVIGPWRAIAAINEDQIARQLPELLEDWEKSNGLSIHPEVKAALAREPLPRTYAEVAARYGDVFRRALAANAWCDRNEHCSLASVREFLEGADQPLDIQPSGIEDYLFVDVNLQNKYQKQQRLVEDCIASAGAAPHALILRDLPEPVSPRVFIRGNAANLGKPVPRQFLEVLSGPDRRPFHHGSGRLELAEAIASPENPLTARVIANRVWMHHFGAGLVRTPSDFGQRSDPPSHPELLDYLASRLIQNGWSIKALHREIMLSAVYQQQSRTPPESDPENRLLSQFRRRRLDWEAFRDSVMCASGSLDLTMGGPSQRLFEPPFSGRRSVYGEVDRLNLASVLRSFDFASPEATNGERYLTTIPQQALFGMNSPFFAEQVRRTANRMEFRTAADDEARIKQLYELLFGREPTRAETSLGQQFLASAPSAEADGSNNGRWFTPWEEYVQVLLLSNEFSFVD